MLLETDTPISKADACDIENFLEYEAIVKKILERKPNKAITISIDAKDIDKAVKKSADSDQESEDGDDEQVDVCI